MNPQQLTQSLQNLVAWFPNHDPFELLQQNPQILENPNVEADPTYGKWWLGLVAAFFVGALLLHLLSRTHSECFGAKHMLVAVLQACDGTIYCMPCCAVPCAHLKLCFAVLSCAALCSALLCSALLHCAVLVSCARALLLGPPNCLRRCVALCRTHWRICIS
jgi:hypothetical protein